MASADRSQRRAELVTHLEKTVAILKDRPFMETQAGWTTERAEEYATLFQEFRERLIDGTTTDQDRKRSYTRGLDFYGLSHGQLSFLVARVDELRAKYFAAPS